VESVGALAAGCIGGKLLKRLHGKIGNCTIELFAECGSSFMKSVRRNCPRQVAMALTKGEIEQSNVLIQFEIEPRQCAAARRRRAD
jgi:hypothetical protein